MTTPTNKEKKIGTAYCNKCHYNTLLCKCPSRSQSEWEERVREIERIFESKVMTIAEMADKGDDSGYGHALAKLTVYFMETLRTELQKVSESSKEEGYKQGYAEQLSNPNYNDGYEKGEEEMESRILKLIEGKYKTPLEKRAVDELGRPQLTPTELMERAEERGYNNALSDLKNLINKR